MAAVRDALWRTARRVADQLKREGARAVAVSGSLARGDHGPASDVDLWAIHTRGAGRDERFVGGVPVTVFRSTPAQLTNLHWVNQWDVERLVVLFDTRQDFAKLRLRYARHAGALRRTVEQRLVAEAKIAAPPRRAWLELQLAVFRATGTRVPKWKHAQALLGSRALATLRRKLELPRRLDRTRLLRLVRAAPRETARLINEPVPRWAAAEHMLKHGGTEETVLKLRAELDGWLRGVDLRRSKALHDLSKAIRFP